MQAKVIVAFLLGIVTASQPAFTAVRSKVPNDDPPQVAMVGVAADHAYSGGTVLVPMPFSSLQLNPSLVEYLGLKPTQARSIQRLMDRERPKTESLMLQLRTVNADLGVAIRRNQNNDDKGVASSLAATQARLLKQLMTANLRLQRRIDDVLDPQQRKKLDAFKAEISVVDDD